MTQSNDKARDCFGKLEIVFPLGNDGLRHTPAPCMECAYKTECLRTGLRGQTGLKVHEEHIDRSYESGMMSFWERWSKKKAINRRKNSGKTSGFNWQRLRRKTTRK
ncbi:MAG: hypothetical protein JRF56_13500 [Deltaproteobacteria bacterium]|jgi:hypothetical protein|nr:hypothetical protein [Deltaproteobacteria bacterium]